MSELSEGYHRKPKTRRERREGQQQDEMEPKVRAKRNAVNLPSYGDEVTKTYGDRTWKKYRKTQYKKVNEKFSLLEELEILEHSVGDYDLYHNTYSEAISHAIEMAKSRGYEVDDEEVAERVGMGPRKPSPGNHNQIDLTLYKDGRPLKKMLHIVVAHLDDRDTNPYELTMYIS